MSLDEEGKQKCCGNGGGGKAKEMWRRQQLLRMRGTGNGTCIITFRHSDFNSRTSFRLFLP